MTLDPANGGRALKAAAHGTHMPRALLALALACLTATSATHVPHLVCGSTYSGDTQSASNMFTSADYDWMEPAVGPPASSVVQQNSGRDAIHRLCVDYPTTVSIRSCGTDFDSVLYVATVPRRQDVPEYGGIHSSSSYVTRCLSQYGSCHWDHHSHTMAQCDNCGTSDQCSSSCCAQGANDAVLQADLPLGCYDVIMSGRVSSDWGVYDLQVDCPPSPPAMPPGTLEMCSGEIDLILVIDDSGSIVEEWNEVKEFALGVLRQFNVTDGGVRVGAVYFTSEATTMSTLTTDATQAPPSTPTHAAHAGRPISFTCAPAFPDGV